VADYEQNRHPVLLRSAVWLTKNRIAIRCCSAPQRG